MLRPPIDKAAFREENTTVGRAGKHHHHRHRHHRQDEGHAVAKDCSSSFLATVTMASSLLYKQYSNEEYDPFFRLVMLPYSC